MLAEKALKEYTELDAKGFDITIAAWEWQWVNKRKDYPVVPAGNVALLVKALYQKYRQKI